MRFISYRSGIDAESDFRGGDFSMVKNTLVSQFGGAHYWTIGGTRYNSNFVANYYDEESAYPYGDNPDGWVTDSGWNRKLVIAGNGLQFDGNRVPVAGNIEAIAITNVNEDTMIAIVDIEGLSAADFNAAWYSSTTQDDKELMNSIFGAADGDSGDATGGSDTLTGSGADDTLDGLGGNDRLKGAGGDDTLAGGSGRDKLLGGRGNDVLEGDGGNDRLIGGGGRDTLDGGRGDDMLKGGGGADCFVFNSRFGDDTITDFQTKGRREKIDLSDVSTIKHFRDLKNNHLSEDADGNAVISDNRGNTITLEDVAMGDLSGNDFIF